MAKILAGASPGLEEECVLDTTNTRKARLVLFDINSDTKIDAIMLKNAVVTS